LPSTFIQAAILLIAVLPGLIFGVVRTSLRGFGEQDATNANRILQAFVVGIFIDVLYVLILGRSLVALTNSQQLATADPRTVAWLVMTLGFVLPAALALLTYARRFELRSFERLPFRLPMPVTPYRSSPTAWDYIAPRQGGKWIKVRLPDGKWAGGWYSVRSYISTYPQPRDIFIEDQHYVDDDGTIGDIVEDTAGMWISIPDGAVVVWNNPSNN
jgi:hypothetical protein